MEIYKYRLTDREGFISAGLGDVNRKVSEIVKDDEFIVDFDENGYVIDISFDGKAWISVDDHNLGFFFTKKELEDFCIKTPINLVS